MSNDIWSRGPLELVFAEHPGFADTEMLDVKRHLGTAVAVWNASIGWGLRDVGNVELNGIAPCIKRFRNPNTVIVPQVDGCSEIHVLMSELLSPQILRHHRILVRIGNAALWPLTVRPPACQGFARRVEDAFCDLMWGQLVRKDQRKALKRDSSLRILVDDSKFWMHQVYRVVAERLAAMPRDQGHEKKLLWDPSDEHQRQQMVKAVLGSKQSGSVCKIAQLLSREILPEDLSDKRHSMLKEDVQRRLYSKRRKYKVVFCEIDDRAIAYDANPLSTDGEFILREVMVLLDAQEQRIIALLRDGFTHNEIAPEFGVSRPTIDRRIRAIQAKLTPYLR